MTDEQIAAHEKALKILRHPDDHLEHELVWVQDDVDLDDKHVLTVGAALAKHRNPVIREVGLRILSNMDERKFPLANDIVGWMRKDIDPSIRACAEAWYMPTLNP